MNDRAATWAALSSQPFDVLVVGGGVTGAAVLFEAARRGLRAALVERNDFASGTSSRSSKLVHGGLRYLREGKIGLTRESVRERQSLLHGAPGLIEPLAFVMPHYTGRKPSRTTLSAGLAVYDALAGSWRHRFAGAQETLNMVPALYPHDLIGAHCYGDATTDDARLVLRLLHQACDAGAVATNYVDAAPVVHADRVRGAQLTDTLTGKQIEVSAAAVIAATGAFADSFRNAIGAPARLRPLRGSHLVVADWRLPLAQAVAFQHPDDGRPVFAYPWLGQTLVGTTDLDHHADLAMEPSITREETAYLIDAARYMFPSLELTPGDVVATFAGVRPIVAHGGDAAPSQASRDHVVWNERGLVTITGGKLTTFRPMALDALKTAAPQLPAFDLTVRPAFAAPTLPSSVLATPSQLRRFAGRYGAHAQNLIAQARAGELEPVGASAWTWAELRWALQNEAVVHLDDLLLRRTRIGLLERNGGAAHFDRIGELCRTELSWNDARWQTERDAFAARMATSYGVNPAA